jgi:hypothetical protein
MADLLIISDKIVLSLDEAKAEYIELSARLADSPEHGWAHWLEYKIENRLTYLRKTISDYICEVKK